MKQGTENSVDRIFAKAVLKAGFASRETVAVCRNALTKSEEASHSKRLPDVMVERGVLTDEQVHEILKVLRAALVTCPECGRRRYVRPDRDPLRPCRQCRYARQAVEEPLRGASEASPAPTGPPAPDGDAAEPGESAGEQRAADSAKMPRAIAHLRLLRRIAGNDEAGLYKAFNTSLDQIVAVEVFSPVMAHREPALVDGLLKGARVTARLAHRNLVRVSHVGKEADRPFIEMEFVDGLNLAQLLRTRSPLPVDQLVPIVMQVGDALKAVHGAGLIHGSVTLENVILGRGHVVKLTGFGLAAGAVQRPLPPMERTTLEAVAGLAPEALLGGPVDARSDIYSLGVVFFRAATGRLPYAAESAVDFVAREGWSQPRDPCALNPRLPRVLGDIILRMLAREPASRFAGAQAFLAALESATTVEGGPRLGQLKDGEVVAMYPITSEPLVIGREPGCSIMLADERVSRRHTRVSMRARTVDVDDVYALGPWAGLGRLTLRGREVAAEDLKSSNGTRINGHRVSGKVLLPGDTMCVGAFHFVYLVPGMPVKRDASRAVGWIRGRMPDGAAVEKPVTEVPILVGRLAEADVSIQGRGIADVTAQIVATADGAQMTDLTAGSSEPVQLADGQVLEFGPVRLTYRRSSAVAPRGSGLGDMRVEGGLGLAGGERLTDLLAAEAERAEMLVGMEGAPRDAAATQALPTADTAGSEASAWRITARSGPCDGQTFAIGGREEILIGSGADCGISLADALVSERHARVVRREGDMVMENLGGKDGVMINGRRIKKRPLKPGDVITIGSTEFLVHM